MTKILTFMPVKFTGMNVKIFVIFYNIRCSFFTNKFMIIIQFFYYKYNFCGLIFYTNQALLRINECRYILIRYFSTLGVIRKSRPQGGGEGGQGKRGTCGHRGEGGQARVDVHKKILKKVSKKTWVDGKNSKSYI